MFLKFDAIEHGGDTPIPEICTFKGIRFDMESSVAILSTEHVGHDYLMPVESIDEYKRMSEKLYLYLSKALSRQGMQVAIEGSPVIRVKHGGRTVVDNVSDYHYTVKAVCDEASFEIGRLSGKRRHGA